MMELLTSPTFWILLLLAANLALTFVIGAILAKGINQLPGFISEAVWDAADEEYLPYRVIKREGLKSARYNLPRRVADAVAKRLAAQAE